MSIPMSKLYRNHLREEEGHHFSQVKLAIWSLFFCYLKRQTLTVTRQKFKERTKLNLFVYRLLRK